MRTWPFLQSKQRLRGNWGWRTLCSAPGARCPVSCSLVCTSKNRAPLCGRSISCLPTCRVRGGCARRPGLLTLNHALSQVSSPEPPFQLTPPHRVGGPGAMPTPSCPSTLHQEPILDSQEPHLLPLPPQGWGKVWGMGAPWVALVLGQPCRGGSLGERAGGFLFSPRSGPCVGWTSSCALRPTVRGDPAARAEWLLTCSAALGPQASILRRGLDARH